MVSFLFLLLGISHSTSVMNKVLIDFFLMKMNGEFIIHVSLQFDYLLYLCGIFDKLHHDYKYHLVGRTGQYMLSTILQNLLELRTENKIQIQIIETEI